MGFKYGVCVCLWGGHVRYISRVRCVSVVILLLSMTVVWEPLKGGQT